MEIGIRLVLRVAVAIVHDRVDLLPLMLPHRGRRAPAVSPPLVDVVPGVEDEIELLFGDPAVRGEVPGLVVAAAADRESQTVDGRSRRGRGLRPADLADLVAGPETVQVVAAGLQACHLDVDAVTELGPGDGRASLRHGPEGPVGGDLPLHFDVGHRHAAALERFRREPRPEHDAVRQRIAGGHSERERIRHEERTGERLLRRDRPRDRRQADAAGDLQQLPP